MKGIYYCEYCNLYIEVKSFAHVHKSNQRFDIKRCPHCHGRLIDISLHDFLTVDASLWIRVLRTFTFKHIGEKDIELSLKFVG